MQFRNVLNQSTITFALCTALGSVYAAENTPMVDCATIDETKSYELSISPNSGFKNCFRIVGRASDDITVTYGSKDNVDTRIKFYAAAGTNRNLVSYYQTQSTLGSDYTRFSAISVETYFILEPLNKLSTSKDVKINLTSFEGRRFLFVSVFDGQEKK